MTVRPRPMNPFRDCGPLMNVSMLDRPDREAHRIRKTRVTFHRPIPPTTFESSAEDAALARLEIERIVDSIASLPAEQRAVLVLCDVQGLSGTATAQALGLSRAAMKSRLHRGRETLHSALATPSNTPSNADGEDAGSEDARP